MWQVVWVIPEALDDAWSSNRCICFWILGVLVQLQIHYRLIFRPRWLARAEFLYVRCWWRVWCRLTALVSGPCYGGCAGLQDSEVSGLVADGTLAGKLGTISFYSRSGDFCADNDDNRYTNQSLYHVRGVIMPIRHEHYYSPSSSSWVLPIIWL